MTSPPRRHPTPVFLHTAWRGRGTWLWSGLRRAPSVMAFYEPLHEALATLTPGGIAATRPDSWPSGHETMAPYWTEFAALLRTDRPGVPGFRTGFTLDLAFAGADMVQPELAAYLLGLLRHAAKAGQTPVLKFCRSLGRVAWMQATFPDALHVVVLRQPEAQWHSARQQLDMHGNPYFIAMPLLMLARNAEAPLVADACRALRIRPPAHRLLRQADLPKAMEACLRLVEHLSWADRYRFFLAHWMAGTLSALTTDGPVVDADMLVWSAQYRREVTAAIQHRSDLRMALQTERRPAPSPVPDPDEGMAHRSALELLQQYRTSLRPDGYVLAWYLLAGGLVRQAPPLPPEHSLRPDLTSPSELSLRAEPDAQQAPRGWFTNPWRRPDGTGPTTRPGAPA